MDGPAIVDAASSVALEPSPWHGDDDDAAAAKERANLNRTNVSAALPGANVIVFQETLKDADWTKMAASTIKPDQISEEFSRFPPHPSQMTADRKFFCYQPSGGWGNQRYILRWAMIAAAAMKRTLLVAPIAPHSDIWHGFNEFNKSQVVSAGLILDIRAIQKAMAPYGAVFLDDLPIRAVEAAKVCFCCFCIAFFL